MSKFLNGKKLGLLSVLGLMASAQAFAWGGYVSIVFDPATNQKGSYHGGQPGEYTTHEQILAAALQEAGLSYYQLQTGEARETWAHNGWAALARCNDGTYHTAGVHTGQYEAEQDALRHCGYSYGYDGQAYPNGTVLRSAASFDYAPDPQGTVNW